MKRHTVIAIAVAALAAGLAFAYAQYRAAQTRRIVRSARCCLEIGLALEAYAVDHQGQGPEVLAAIAPLQPAPMSSAGNRQMPTWPPHTPVVFLRPYLVPRYISSMPDTDAWGHPLLFSLSPDRHRYVVASLGSNASPEPRIAFAWPRHQVWRDIVFADGSFLSLADGFTH